ncbi:hypothetical protein G6F68_015398 [Rhizopus microsporus]|nr:hypothetical protein G6F68_015398 [Rhizopus microsporus]
MSDPAPPPSLDALGTPLAWAGADGCIAGCNPAFARWLGVSARRLLGRPLAALEPAPEPAGAGRARRGAALRRGLDEPPR